VGKTTSRSFKNRLNFYYGDSNKVLSKVAKALQAVWMGAVIEFQMMPLATFPHGITQQEACALEAAWDCLTHSGPTPGASRSRMPRR